MIVSCIKECSFITWSKVILQARPDFGGFYISLYTGCIHKNKFLPDVHKNLFDCWGFITIFKWNKTFSKKTGVSKIFNLYYMYEKLVMNFKTTGEIFSNFSKLVLTHRMNYVF